MISTRGRYALRVMVDLAEHMDDGYIPMKEVAKRQGISLKYLERIVPVLSKNNLIEGVHGKGGGYRLNRTPESYTVGEILRLVEGDLAPVACLACGAKPCERRPICKTISMWERYYALINEFFDGITIADLVCGTPASNHVDVCGEMLSPLTPPVGFADSPVEEGSLA